MASSLSIFVEGRTVQLMVGLCKHGLGNCALNTVHVTAATAQAWTLQLQDVKKPLGFETM